MLPRSGPALLNLHAGLARKSAHRAAANTEGAVRHTLAQLSSATQGRHRLGATRPSRRAKPLGRGSHAANTRRRRFLCSREPLVIGFRCVRFVAVTPPPSRCLPPAPAAAPGRPAATPVAPRSHPLRCSIPIPSHSLPTCFPEFPEFPSDCSTPATTVLD